MKKERVIHVCGGLAHMLILTQSKRIYCMGKNDYGELGMSGNNQRICSCIDPMHFNNETIIQICAGSCHSLILTQNGNVYSWGSGKYGQLGHGDKSNKNIPTKVDPIYFNNEPIKCINTKFFCSFALTKKNNLYAWGVNYNGQLSLRNVKKQFKPELIDSNIYNNETIIKIECANQHTFLLTQSSNGFNNIYSCGYNHDGQLGLGHIHDKNTFQLVDSNHFQNEKIKDIKAGRNYSLALVEEKNTRETKIYAWGSNQFGKLFSTDKEYINIPHKIDSSNFNGEKIISIGTGQCHSLAITKDEKTNKTKVYVWGGNHNGELGVGHWNTILKPTPINMNHFKEQSPRAKSSKNIVFIDGNSGLFGYSFAITKTGKLFAWGDNRYSQLGLGHCRDMNTPQPCFPELFGEEITNEKLYKNASFEDVLFEFI